MRKLYAELAEWWPLLSAPEDYTEEAALFEQTLLAQSPIPRTVLELGSGGGNNASFLKKSFAMTLSDVSEAMLAVSRALNPDCEHVCGDMRTLRLGRVFDAVFVHDAICYMTSEADLREAFETAYVHCAPGGVVLIAADWVTETFTPTTEHGGEDGAERALRYLEWCYDPDPTDTTYNTEYVIVLKEGAESVHIMHERHVEGIFPERTWRELLTATGFTVEWLPDPNEPTRVLFLGRKR